MAKQRPDRTMTIDQYKAVIERYSERYLAALASESPPTPAQCCEIEAAIDAARIAGIHLAFDGRSESARDHCISQGLSIDVAETAAATRGVWRSPAGGMFGIEQPKNVSAPIPQSSDAPAGAVGTEAEPIAAGFSPKMPEPQTSTTPEPSPS